MVPEKNDKNVARNLNMDKTVSKYSCIVKQYNR